MLVHLASVAGEFPVSSFFGSASMQGFMKQRSETVAGSSCFISHTALSRLWLWSGAEAPRSADAAPLLTNEVEVESAYVCATRMPR